MAVNLSPIGNDAPFLDSSGNPLSGGKLYTYTAGSSTAQTTYTTSAGSVANANPVVLNSGGYPAASGSVVSIWLTAGVSYKFVLKTSADVEVWTRDNISGINDTTVTIDQWVSGAAPTYISGTSFSLVGDQTSTYHIGRRLKSTNSGGTIYSTISNSVFGALTTITVVNDSGVLDSGLSAVSYGLLSNTNFSVPSLRAAGDWLGLNAAGTLARIPAVATVTAHATTMDLFTARENVLSGGAVTVTDIADAPYVGAVSWAKMNAAHVWTDGAVFDVQGGANYTAAAGDWVRLYATTLSTFELTVFRANGSVITMGTAQATTSGTAIDFTGIPAGVKRITINFVGVSLSGTTNLLVQLGDAGGFEATTYLGASTLLGAGASSANYTTGFGISTGDASYVVHGRMVLELENAAAFTWTASGVVSLSNTAATITSAGSKSLSAELTQVRITTTGADTFDAGAINIQWE